MSSPSEPKVTADQAALARLGARVRERLAANPEVYRLPTEEAEIYAVGDFMTLAECERMRAMIDACAKPSTVYDLDYSAGFRTSYSGDVDPHDPFVRKIDRRMDDLLGMDGEWGETLQGQRYLPGQEFQPHHDWFHPDTNYWKMEMKRGGQRAYTAMVFLNEVAAGGATEFTELRTTFTPRPGVLLAWNNADVEGAANPMTMHAGRPVSEGVKYVVTKWYRTRRWF